MNNGPENRMNLFAYGTLIDPEIMRRAACELPRRGWGTLRDYERRALKGKSYPGLREQSGSFVRGVVYFDVSRPAWERLDRFEGDRYAKKEVTVLLDDGSTALAWVYLTTPLFLCELSEDGWDYEEFRREGKADFQELYEGFDE